MTLYSKTSQFPDSLKTTSQNMKDGTECISSSIHGFAGLEGRVYTLSGEGPALWGLGFRVC